MDLPMSAAACAWCGALPAGTAGHTGEHRRDCPGDPDTDRDEDKDGKP